MDYIHCVMFWIVCLNSLVQQVWILGVGMIEFLSKTYKSVVMMGGCTNACSEKLRSEISWRSPWYHFTLTGTMCLTLSFEWITDTLRELDVAPLLAASVLQWPLIFPIDPHYKRDICKTFDRTAQTANNYSTAQLLLCVLETLKPWRFYSCKTFREPRKAVLCVTSCKGYGRTDTNVHVQ